MRWARELVGAAMLVCIAGLGCDSEGSGTPAGGDIDRLARAACGAYRECCRQAGHGLEPLAACESVFKQEVTAFRYVEQGSSRFDPAVLDRCIASFERAAGQCTVTDQRQACNGLFVGTREEGSSCTNVAECRSDSTPMVCLRGFNADGGTGSGICRQSPRAKLGEPCRSTCESGDQCNSTYSTSEPDPPLGLCYEEDGLYCDFEACARHLALGASCSYDEQCGPTRACSTVSGTGGICEDRRPAGANCERFSQCQAPLGCVAGRCAPPTVVSDRICIEGDLD